MVPSITVACLGAANGNNRMERQQVIQELIDKRNYKTYLEIGVLGGNVFFGIRCEKKIAVDPEFKFNWKGRVGESIRNLRNINATFFEVTSDEFFGKQAGPAFQKRKLDIALIDGMHEFDFVLNDVNNCLRYLSGDGVLVLHDCNPVTYEAGVSFKEWKDRGHSGYWNGDVWKVIPYLRKHRPDLDIFVADCDHGLGIISRNGGQAPATNGSREEFKNMTYADLERRRNELLNLKPESHLAQFISQR